jgi:hypothetical protein
VQPSSKVLLHQVLSRVELWLTVWTAEVLYRRTKEVKSALCVTGILTMEVMVTTVTKWNNSKNNSKNKETTMNSAKSVNYMQRVGPDSCVRCDFVTDASKSFAEQDADMHKHLDEQHPGWMLDGLRSAQPVESDESWEASTAILAAQDQLVTANSRLTDAQIYEASIRLQGQFREIPTREFIEGLAELVQYSDGDGPDTCCGSCNISPKGHEYDCPEAQE